MSSSYSIESLLGGALQTAGVKNPIYSSGASPDLENYCFKSTDKYEKRKLLKFLI